MWWECSNIISHFVKHAIKYLCLTLHCLPSIHIVYCPQCWRFCCLCAKIVPWQVPQITLHSNAGAVKWPFALHEQSPAVAQLATVHTTAALEGPLWVGLTNFCTFPFRLFYDILHYSMTYRYRLTYKCVWCMRWLHTISNVHVYYFSSVKRDVLWTCTVSCGHGDIPTLYQIWFHSILCITDNSKVFTKSIFISSESTVWIGIK